MKIISVPLESVDKIAMIYAANDELAYYMHFAEDNSLKCLDAHRCFPIFLLVFISIFLRAIANPA